MSDYRKGLLYCFAFGVPAYVATRLVTGSPILAFLAGVTTVWFAREDWRTRHSAKR